MVTIQPLPLSTKDVTGGQAIYRFQPRVQGYLFSIILWDPVTLGGAPVLHILGVILTPAELTISMAEI